VDHADSKITHREPHDQPASDTQHSPYGQDKQVRDSGTIEGQLNGRQGGSPAHQRLTHSARNDILHCQHPVPAMHTDRAGSLLVGAHNTAGELVYTGHVGTGLTTITDPADQRPADLGGADLFAAMPTMCSQGIAKEATNTPQQIPWPCRFLIARRRNRAMYLAFTLLSRRTRAGLLSVWQTDHGGVRESRCAAVEVC
jgi:hypothetical protein